MNTQSCSTNIMMLVKDTSLLSHNIKLIMIVIDAWKRIDRTRLFDEPEQVYEFLGTVAEPPPELQKGRLYSYDQIKEVQLIVNESTVDSEKSTNKIMTLVI